jgi:hypothetical protein
VLGSRTSPSASGQAERKCRKLRVRGHNAHWGHGQTLTLLLEAIFFIGPVAVSARQGLSSTLLVRTTTPLAPLRQPLSRHRATAADVVRSHPVGPNVIVIDFCLFLPAVSSAPSSSGNTAGTGILPLAMSYYSLNQIEISNRLSQKSARIKAVGKEAEAITRWADAAWPTARSQRGRRARPISLMDSRGGEEGGTEVDFRATARAGGWAPETTRPCHRRHRGRQAATEEGVIKVGSYVDPRSSGRRSEGGD